MAKGTEPKTLADYVRETQTLPEEVTLGNLIWFTVTEEQHAPVSRDQLERQFDALNLNPEYLPYPNRPVDAYKKATSDIERDRSEDRSLPDGKRFNILMRDVSSDKEKIVRHIVLEIVNAQEVRLSHDKVGEAVFYHAPYATAGNGKRQPKGHRMIVKVDAPADRALAGKLAKIRDRIQTTYQHDCQYLDAQKLRAMVREYLLYLNAVQLKPSVYFVHKSRSDEVTRLATLVDTMNNGSSMFFMPMPDLEKVRDEVIEKFQTEAAASVQTLVQEIAQVRSSRKKITPEMFGKFKARYDDVAGKALEYTRTLGIAQEETGAVLELAMDSLIELQEAAASQVSAA